MMDPPDHTRYRRVVSRAFTARTVAGLETHVRKLAGSLLDAALLEGTCDFVVDVSSRLPLDVIAELLGVPQEDRPKIFEWSNRLSSPKDPEYVVSPDAVREAQFQMFMYANQLAEANTASGKDDLVTAMVSAEVDGEALSTLDFNMFFLLLAVAGNETTRNGISHAVDVFLDSPEVFELVASDVDAHLDRAIDEVLRWSTPIMYFRRNATRDMELHGRAIRAGDKVSMWYAAANRDATVFDDADTFVVDRNPNPHLAFGGGGPHHCLGAQLAKLELRVLLEELFDRVRSMDRAGPAKRLRSNFINGIKHLPVRLRA